MGINIEDGNETKYIRMNAEGYFLDSVSGYDNIEDIDDIEAVIGLINEISEKNVFLEGIKRIIVAKGYEGDTEDAASMRNYLQSLFIKNKVVDENDRPIVNRVTLGNWLEGSVPGDDVTNRPNVFALCFALELTLRETMEFFVKSYLNIPFNYGGVREGGYYYCFNEGFGYSKARELICEIEKTANNFDDSVEDANFTYNAQNNIMTLQNDEELMKVIMGNYSNMRMRLVRVNNKDKFVLQDNKGALNELRLLVEESIVKVKNDKYSISKNAGIETVISDIYDGYQDFIHNNACCEDYVSFSKLKSLPKKIRTNIPSKKAIHDLFKDGTVKKHDNIRKAILLRNFYNFYMDLEKSGEECKQDYREEFICELDCRLERCGYLRTYAKNPYDCLFMICANQEEPLQAFRYIMGKYVEKNYE